MPQKLAYYASQVAPDKPNQFETIEGCRIYKNVPICRTGFQEYAGSELKGHKDYNDDWNLDDNEMVKVYRPKKVVTAPETVASFEGKSVLDGHPPEVLITVDNEEDHGKGHVQNVRVGPVMDDGETPLIADLWVKNELLNDKIDGGMRDVSCGYLHRLKRAEDGTFFMSKIIGNHVAVVPNGRAGPEVAIGDAAAVEVVKNIRPMPEIKERVRMAKTKQGWVGRLLKTLGATDADPEDLEMLAKSAEKDEDEDDMQRQERERRDQEMKDRKARDAEEKMKKAKDAEPDDSEYELHPQLAEACDHVAHMRGTIDAMAEHLGIGKPEDEKPNAEGDDEMPEAELVAGDADVLEMTEKEQGETELPQQIARDEAFLAEVRPLVIASKNPKKIAAFNTKVKSMKLAKKAIADGAPNVYTALAAIGSPFDNPEEEEVDPSSFFNGVNFAEGQKRFDAYKAKQKELKGGKK